MKKILFLLLLLFIIPIVKSSANHFSRTITYYVISCSIFTTEANCTSAGCYWWDNACHSYTKAVPVYRPPIPKKPPVKPVSPYFIFNRFFLIGGIIIFLALVLLLSIKFIRSLSRL